MYKKMFCFGKTFIEHEEKQSIEKFKKQVLKFCKCDGSYL